MYIPQVQPRLSARDLYAHFLKSRQDNGGNGNPPPNEGQNPNPQQQDNQDNNNNPPSGVSTPVIIVIAVVIVIIVVVTLIFTRKNTKRSKARRAQSAVSTERLRSTPANFDARTASSHGHSSRSLNNNNNNDVNRQASIRSIMTLPVYNPNATDNEQVLAREGERGGVDIVIEAPTAEEDESLRDQEMEALYQIRVARRQEMSDREERRRLRAEARVSGDILPLQEFEQRRRAASNSSNVDDLRAQHVEMRERRQRAVSSVSYHDLGVARHDGTRLRANSQESERVGLLSDAASIVQSVRAPSATHVRHHSSGSVLSFDSISDMPSPGLPRSRPTTPRLSMSHTRAGSSPEIIDEADLGTGHHSPPDYDEVSLDDRRSSAAAPGPFSEPPPEYSGPEWQPQQRTSIRSVQLEDRVTDGDLSSALHPSPTESSSSRPVSSRGVGGTPQLPSLRIRELPQIVIEPSNVSPTDRR